jgi:hypothetical protein
MSDLKFKALKDAAQALFKKHDGIVDFSVLQAHFTPGELLLLGREGLIEITARPNAWAWKSN